MLSDPLATFANGTAAAPLLAFHVRLDADGGALLYWRGDYDRIGVCSTEDSDPDRGFRPY
jgi:hypothetical protein